ncbi:MAG: DNA polymerase III subunit delta' [Actinomycetota bacterium]|nr:DNA polymerase III subunit delta' [Actinomycetota bacterium]
MTVWDGLDSGRAVAGIRRQLAQGEPSHAWLLSGPSGAGKGAVSDAMAAALNCLDEPLRGCNRCSACRRVLNRAHPDVHRVAPEGSVIAVDAIREGVIPEATRSPFEGRYKVFVLEQAELMNEAAQSALLKTLEEPQPDTVFILLSQAEEEILETIRSRCRSVRLEPTAERHLVELLEREGAAAETALIAARLSEGDAGAARRWAFDSPVGERRALWLTIPRRLQTATDALDAASEILDQARAAGAAQKRTHGQETRALAEVIGEGRGTGTARSAMALRHRREQRHAEEAVLGEALGTLAGFYRDVVAVRRGSTESVANLDRLDELKEWARSSVTDGALMSAAERLINGRAALLSNANVLLALEAALAEVTRLTQPREHSF